MDDQYEDFKTMTDFLTGDGKMREDLKKSLAGDDGDGGGKKGKKKKGKKK
jgi:hypothetical protein